MQCSEHEVWMLEHTDTQYSGQPQEFVSYKMNKFTLITTKLFIEIAHSHPETSAQHQQPLPSFSTNLRTSKHVFTTTV